MFNVRIRNTYLRFELDYHFDNKYQTWLLVDDLTDNKQKVYKARVINLLDSMAKSSLKKELKTVTVEGFEMILTLLI
jgi:hypothetical protein